MNKKLPGIKEDAVKIDNDLGSKGSNVLNVIFQEEPTNWLGSVDPLAFSSLVRTALDH